MRILSPEGNVGVRGIALAETPKVLSGRRLAVLDNGKPGAALILSRIADRLGIPTHRVQYVIATRNIRPTAFAGRLRLFDREAVSLIRNEIDSIDARQAAGKGGPR